MNTPASNRQKNNAEHNKVETLLLERMLKRKREEIRRMEHDKLMIMIEINRSARY
ncbi:MULTISPECIES: hypothetical protein [Acidithiobacillus]|uniref:Transposase n=1 Tax=Acidithiobacillus ferriphilus TaxID=1689834 RepID=A0ABU6FW29_9PROT|nr:MULTISPECIES: hypothetical protein [Acidithiobacillus]MEB8476696.1 hypothetical protein [Acidithiobacillus ferriphilus]MEB8485980.1 hypothetical protein [Acidithiobacillus ferriphilus]MEB8489615.1 hypothetical protein [Acidithiobacillus ferriphilus]MEB8492500.1 hypothetical protein [Acidithiobacillus ferriphilus]MEB8515439.1 hypothetical protein [Acidithiobacillus ferriphilus]